MKWALTDFDRSVLVLAKICHHGRQRVTALTPAALLQSFGLLRPAALQQLEGAVRTFGVVKVFHDLVMAQPRVHVLLLFLFLGLRPRHLRPLRGLSVLALTLFLAEAVGVRLWLLPLVLTVTAPLLPRVGRRQFLLVRLVLDGVAADVLRRRGAVPR